MFNMIVNASWITPHVIITKNALIINQCEW